MDGTVEKQDSSQQAGDTSGASQGTSEQDRTYTKAELEKAVNDALSAAGRDAKSISQKMDEANRILTEATTLKAEVMAAQAKWQEEKDRAELEAVSHDPDAMSAVQLRQSLRAKEAELLKDRAELDKKLKEHEDAIAEVAKFKREKTAIEIATKHNVEVAPLLEHTDGSPEKMEALAQLLPKKGQQQTPPAVKADSGVTAGGFEELSPREKIKRALDLESKT